MPDSNKSSPWPIVVSIIGTAFGVIALQFAVFEFAFSERREATATRISAVEKANDDLRLSTDERFAAHGNDVASLRASTIQRFEAEDSNAATVRIWADEKFEIAEDEREEIEQAISDLQTEKVNFTHVPAAIQPAGTILAHDFLCAEPDNYDSTLLVQLPLNIVSD